MSQIHPWTRGTPAMGLTKRQYERIAAFRYNLRRFLRFSEKAVRQRGVTPHQYQLMLAIQGFPNRDHASVGELAEQLQRTHHSVVELINRTEKLRLIRRQPSKEDRRRVNIFLTWRGKKWLAQMVREHRREVQYLHSSLQKALEHLKSPE